MLIHTGEGQNTCGINSVSYMLIHTDDQPYTNSTYITLEHEDNNHIPKGDTP